MHLEDAVATVVADRIISLLVTPRTFMKSILAASLAISALLAGPLPARAADSPPLSAAYQQCEAKAHSEDPALMQCESAEFMRQDARLNDAYQQLLRRLSKSKTEELRKVQRAWLAYVESKCGFLYDGDDFNGTLDRLVANHCSVVERARRAEELELLVRHQGG